MKNFTREELIDIRNRAKDISVNVNFDISMKTAYEVLALAADSLDAMIARTNVIGTQGPPLDILSICSAPDCGCYKNTGCEKTN